MGSNLRNIPVVFFLLAHGSAYAETPESRRSNPEGIDVKAYIQSDFTDEDLPKLSESLLKKHPELKGPYDYRLVVRIQKGNQVVLETEQDLLDALSDRVDLARARRAAMILGLSGLDTYRIAALDSREAHLHLNSKNWAGFEKSGLHHGRIIDALLVRAMQSGDPIQADAISALGNLLDLNRAASYSESANSKRISSAFASLKSLKTGAALKPSTQAALAEAIDRIQRSAHPTAQEDRAGLIKNDLVRNPVAALPSDEKRARDVDVRQVVKVSVVPLDYEKFEKGGLKDFSNLRSIDPKTSHEFLFRIEGDRQTYRHETEGTLLEKLEGADLEAARMVLKIIGAAGIDDVYVEDAQSLKLGRPEGISRPIRRKSGFMVEALLKIATNPENPLQSDAISALADLLREKDLFYFQGIYRGAKPEPYLMTRRRSSYLPKFAALLNDRRVGGKAHDTLRSALYRLYWNRGHVSKRAFPVPISSELDVVRVTSEAPKALISVKDGEPIFWKKSMKTPDYLIATGRFKDRDNIDFAEIEQVATDVSLVQDLLSSERTRALRAARILGEAGIQEPHIIEALFIGAGVDDAEIAESSRASLSKLIAAENARYGQRLKSLLDGAGSPLERNSFSLSNLTGAQRLLVRQIVQGMELDENCNYLLEDANGGLVSDVALLKAVDGENAERAKAAISKLVELGSQEAVLKEMGGEGRLKPIIETLLAHANSPQSQVRAEAIEALGWLVSPDSIYASKVFELAAEDGSAMFAPRDAVQRALKRINSKLAWFRRGSAATKTPDFKMYVRPLTDLLPDKSFATNAALEAARKKSFLYAEQSAKDSSRTRPRYSIAALGKGLDLQETDASLIEKLYNYNQPRTQLLAARLLGGSGLGGERHIRDALFAAMFDPRSPFELRNEAFGALDHLLPREAAPRQPEWEQPHPAHYRRVLELIRHNPGDHWQATIGTALVTLVKLDTDFQAALKAEARSFELANEEIEKAAKAKAEADANVEKARKDIQKGEKTAATKTDSLAKLVQLAAEAMKKAAEGAKNKGEFDTKKELVEYLLDIVGKPEDPDKIEAIRSLKEALPNTPVYQNLVRSLLQMNANARHFELAKVPGPNGIAGKNPARVMREALRLQTLREAELLVGNVSGGPGPLIDELFKIARTPSDPNRAKAIAALHKLVNQIHPELQRFVALNWGVNPPSKKDLEKPFYPERRVEFVEQFVGEIKSLRPDEMLMVWSMRGNNTPFAAIKSSQATVVLEGLSAEELEYWKEYGELPSSSGKADGASRLHGSDRKVRHPGGLSAEEKIAVLEVRQKWANLEKTLAVPLGDGKKVIFCELYLTQPSLPAQ